MAGDVNVTEALHAALRAAGAKQAAIANNIANVDTPGYRRRDVRFQELLARAVERGRGVGDVQPETFQPKDTPLDSTGNDVNVEQEIAELIKNSGAYKTYLRLLSKTYRQMEYAMRTE